MMICERVFPNPLLAEAFKQGVDFVADPDVRASSPVKVKDGSGNWKVIIEDDNDHDEEGQATTASTKPTKVSFDEFRQLTKKNMVPVNAKSEPGAVIIPTIAEPKTSPRPRGRVIIPVDETDIRPTSKVKPCNDCINCKTGDECILVLAATCEYMDGRER